jgi:SAM-dependent methyltransferase
MTATGGAADAKRSGDAAMAELQERYHHGAHDYEPGSPHLRHARVRNEIVGRIRGLVAAQFARTGCCRVVEIGAGHGSFTDHLAAMGAEVTVTEMSRPSLDRIRERFAWNGNVRMVHDPDGTAVFADGAVYDLALCVSVLHHIPDYVGFVRSLAGCINEGGAFASFQDPLWYPRRTRVQLAADRTAYYAWRLGRGNVRQAVATGLRRARNVHDEGNPADMVEYHVVRSGVDEVALATLLAERFGDVEQWHYWSTQSPLFQAVGSRFALTSTFGLVARGRLAER